MKKLTLKSIGFLAAIMLSLSLMSMTDSSTSRPFIGSSTTTHTEACGECRCTYATTTTYVFWINVGTETNLTGTQC